MIKGRNAMNHIDWLGKPYYSLNAYFKHTYGRKVYKIAVDAGLSCPNRDGSLDTRGCIFCSEGGSGDFAVKIGEGEASSNEGSILNKQSTACSCPRKVISVGEQIARGKERFNKKVGDKFVIYFQAFTNTYGDVEYLRRIWTEALECEDIVGISIATRPDCLGDEVVSLLGELKEKIISKDNKKFIWVELGLQTIHDKTADYIRRHYPLSTYEDAVLKLGRLGIPYITHIILGLPGESKEDMLQTVFYTEQGIFDYKKHSPIKPFGIKLQLLHVLKGTDLYIDYAAGKFETMELEEYINLVIDALQRINPNIVIHRVTGDGPKSILIAPTWSANKKLVLNNLHKEMLNRNARQGDYSIMLW